MTEKYASGRFCCRACANSRARTEESRLMVSETLMKDKNFSFDDYVPDTKKLYLEKNITCRNLKYYKKDMIENVDYVECPYCHARLASIQAKHLRLHNKTVRDVKTEFGEDFKIICDNTTASKIEVGKAAASKIIAEGRHQGWQSRNITSYAEKFWIKVLDNNDITYEREHVVKKSSLGLDDTSNYFLDFLLPGNVDLEIDGKQHKYEDRKQHDIERDALLTANGYIIYRIDWINPSENNKDAVKKQIDDFIFWYKNITKEQLNIVVK